MKCRKKICPSHFSVTRMGSRDTFVLRTASNPCLVVSQELCWVWNQWLGNIKKIYIYSHDILTHVMSRYHNNNNDVSSGINQPKIIGFHGNWTLWSLCEAILWLLPIVFTGCHYSSNRGVQMTSIRTNGSICCCHARNVRRVQSFDCKILWYIVVYCILRYYCHSRNHAIRQLQQYIIAILQ